VRFIEAIYAIALRYHGEKQDTVWNGLVLPEHTWDHRTLSPLASMLLVPLLSGQVVHCMCRLDAQLESYPYIIQLTVPPILLLNLKLPAWYEQKAHSTLDHQM
jgi:hypothetical protein